MKLFLHNEKDEQIINELELGKLDKDKEEMINKIIEFLGENNITDRYKRLVLANRYMLKIDADSGQEIQFS